MELPKWAFKAESRVRGDAAIDMVFRLRPLGRLWIYWCAFVELLRTSTITISIEFQEARPIVSHDGERIEPNVDYILEPHEIEELMKRVPAEQLPRIIRIAKDRCRDAPPSTWVQPK